MGSSNSQTQDLEKELMLNPQDDIHYAGFENKSNLCYVNSILQTLYHCRAFREKVLQYRVEGMKTPLIIEKNPVLLLQEIFELIQQSKKKINILNANRFMQYIRDKNEMFIGEEHQDCHEFLIFVLNQLNDHLKAERPGQQTFLEEVFEGLLVNQTTCLKCCVVSNMNEQFFDISIDLDENTSINYCLKKFNSVEKMEGQDKFRCDKCNSLEDAKKCFIFQKLPKALIIHLKRFKYDEQNTFPLKLQLSSQENVKKMYSLYGIIVHIGNGLQYGHYVSIIKCKDKWLLFDDESISIYKERNLVSLFGRRNNLECAYILCYEEIQGVQQYSLQYKPSDNTQSNNSLLFVNNH